MEIGDEAGEYHSDFDAIDEPVLANDARNFKGNKTLSQIKQGNSNDACGEKGSDSEVESSQTKTKNGEVNKGHEQVGSKQPTRRSRSAKSPSTTNESIFAEAAIMDELLINGTEESETLERGIKFPEEQVVLSQEDNCNVTILRNPLPFDRALIPGQEKGQAVLENTESDEVVSPTQRQNCKSPCTETTDMEDLPRLSCFGINKSEGAAHNSSTEDSCIHVNLQAIKAKDSDRDKVQDGRGSPNSMLGSNEDHTGGYDLDFEDIDYPTDNSDQNADCTGLPSDTLGSSRKAQGMSDTGDALLDQVKSGPGGKQLLTEGHLAVKKNADSEQDIAVHDKQAPVPANIQYVEGQPSMPIHLHKNSESSSSTTVKDDISESNLEAESQEYKTSAQADTALPSQAPFTGDLDSQIMVLNIDDTSETNHDTMEFPFDGLNGRFENGTVDFANDIADIYNENCPVDYEDSWEGEEAQPVDDLEQNFQLARNFAQQ